MKCGFFRSGMRAIVISLPCVKHNSDGNTCPALKAVGWTTAALSVIALGLFVGRELRVRYRFRHRTPYGLYAHAGDRTPEYGVGI